MDKISIEQLYKKFEKPLLRYISYKVSDSFVVNEILNDTFFKASKSLDGLKEKEKIQSWLYKIASNQIIDYYRKRKDKVQELNEQIEFEEEQKDESIIKELDCCVKDFLDTLPKQHANSLKAVYINEFTQKEYAQKNNLNLSTVKSHVKRGKESMKKFFEECCEFKRDDTNQIIECNPKNSKHSC